MRSAISGAAFPVALVLTLGLLLVGAGPSSGEAGGPDATGASRASVRVDLPDGLAEVTVPSGWESNPKLASDNEVLGFLHPAGMKPGQEIPVWVVLGREEKIGSGPSTDQVARILRAGRTHGYAVQESLLVPAPGGKQVHFFRFKPTSDGHACALGLLETVSGFLVLRIDAADPDVWASHDSAIQAILRGARFFPGTRRD